MTTEEKYKKAKQDYADVCKGGKDHYACSLMDISIRSDRLDTVKKELIIKLGTEVLTKLEEEGKL